MYLFKTSGATFDSVIENGKHAFAGQPKDWFLGELVLISKNKVDCSKGEKQIQYTMRLRHIRFLMPGEADMYWPGNEGRWKYLIECDDVKRILRSFNLDEVFGDDSKVYAPILTFKKIGIEHEGMLISYLERVGTESCR